MIAVPGGGTNAMGVSKNVRAWRCTRWSARLLAFCPGGGLILLVAWASEDVRHVLLQQPHARHPSPILEGLLSRYCLARGAFASCCRSFVFVSFAWLRWCEYCAPARFADSTSWISCFATTHWSVVTLDPGKKPNEQPLLLLVDTAIGYYDTWDRRRFVRNLRRSPTSSATCGPLTCGCRGSSPTVRIGRVLHTSLSRARHAHGGGFAGSEV
jgi:hypothetical protein